MIDESTFTFQYGSIQIMSDCTCHSIRYLLHSNMVLFKSTNQPTNQRTNEFYIPIWFYSNDAEYVFYPSEVAFTFQYGSIQILLILSFSNSFSFYIPIWFYSNKYLKNGYSTLSLFTFQYGSIQIDI